MLENLIFLALLCSGGVFSAVWFKRRFEEVLPITVIVMVMVVFLFGVFGFLSAGVIVCLISSVLLYIFCFIRLIVKREFKDFVCNILTPGLVVFCVMFVYLSFANRGRLAYAWDEFSHWMDITKAMVYLDDFGTNPASNSMFQSYPPGMSIFQYILQKIFLWINPNGVFNEWRVFFAYQIFCISIMLPFYSKLSFRKPLSVLLYSVVLLASPLLFFEGFYRDVYIDPFVAVVAGVGITMVFLWEKKDLLYSLNIWLLCGILVLAKDVGLMLALFLAAAYAVDLAFTKECRKSDTNGKAKFFLWGKKTLYMTIAFFVPLLTKLIWRWEVQATKASIEFSGKYDLSAFFEVLLQRNETYFKDVWDNFCLAMFDHSVTIGNSTVTVNYFSLTVLSLLALYLLYRLFANKVPVRRKSFLAVTIVASVQLIVYIFGMAATYMFKFSEYEAVRLASIDRYLNIVFLAGWMLIAISAVYAITNWTSSRGVKLCLFSFLLIVIPLKPMVYLYNGTYVKESVDFRKPYAYLSGQIKNYCDGDDSIYFVCQDTNGYEYWIMRYSSRPNSFNPNGTWGIGETEYMDGMYSVEYTPEEWKEELMLNYDFVVIYKLNDYFYENYSVLFENSNDIQENTLYKVDKKSGVLIKCP